MTLDDALAWMARLAAVATAVAALELLAVRRALADDGVFAWPVLRRELPPALRAVADRVCSYRATLGVLALQLASALALPWVPGAAWLAFGCMLVIAIRFRGTYNGGSDAMLLVVLLAVALDSAAGLAYAAVQLVLSYAVAGVAKLREAAWRDGRALPVLVRLPQYRVPAWAIALLSRPAIARAAGWAMLAFECGSPVALVDPTACAVVLAAGAAFHVANAVVFGLDRFLWSWLAAYPALLYWATR